MLPPLDAALIESGIAGTAFAGRLETHAVLGSTIDRCRRLAEDGAPEGVVVLAEAQTAGRGQPGHAWHSPMGGVYLSALLRPTIEPAGLSILAVIAGLAACEALRGLGAPCRIKLPNDLVAVHARAWRKLGGMLVDTALQGETLRHAILSIGVNVATTSRSMPAPLQPISVSCAELCEVPPAREQVIAALLRRLDACLHEAALGEDALRDRHARDVSAVEPGQAAACGED